ncbi:MAG: hypothetical protein IJS44_00775 [Clostridia bacterium]|nr:hypothetical protein [Clostridia bacterium]
MRNLKKFLALVMAVLMVMSVAVMTGVSAADEADHTEAAHHLNSLSIMKGNENGDLMLANGVTRYQAALFFVQALTGKTDVSVWNAEKKSAIFTDVAEYGTAIDYAYNIGIVRGRGNGVYGYNDPITYQDMLVMAVRALEYETPNMQYPYGYILAAQKLELDEDLDELVNFKAELNRGQTAEIIWNMLNTKIAVDFDGEKIYPEESYYNKYADKYLENNNKTLLEKSGFADGSLVVTIVNTFLNKDENLEDDEDPYVVLNDGLEIKAADLGITEDTLKASYLGLPIKLYIDEKVEKFTQTAYDDEDVSVVFADFYSYTTAENLGDAGNIKYTVKDNDFDAAKKATLTLGSDKFDLTDEDLTVHYYTFDASAKNKGWTEVEADVVLDAFAYNTSDKEYVGGNSYGKIEYRSQDNADDEDKTDLYILYTPYTFGRYFVRSLKDATTAKKADFVTVATYGTTKQTSTYDDVDTYFAEKLIGTSVQVTSDEQTVSRKNGEKAKAVKLTGEAIKSGDFFFGSYNKLDNVLTVAMSAGAFQTGRLNSKTLNTKDGTIKSVKISGTTYSFGFKGVAANADVIEGNVTKIDNIINSLKAGKDNVKYIVADGNVVYVEKTENNAEDDTYFDYVIADFNGKYLADVLDLASSKRNDDDSIKTSELTGGFYVENGEVKFAVLDTATGEWKLATLAGFNYGAYDADDDEFDTEVTNLATIASYEDMTGLKEGTQGYNDYNAAVTALADVNLFAVVEVKDGAYTLAEVVDNVKIADNATNCTAKLLFSDDTAKTNKITSDKDVDAARVTLDADTIIVLLDTTNHKVGVRKGIQKEDNSVDTNVKFYSATSDLILGTVADFTVETWGEASTTIDDDATYYVVTAETEIAYEAEKDAKDNDVYTYTADKLFDLRTGKVVNGIVETVDKKSDSAFNNAAIGDVIYFNGSDEYKASNFATAVKKIAQANDDDNAYTTIDINKLTLDDADTVEYVGALEGKSDGLNGADALKSLSIKVTTVMMDDYTEDYDMDSLYTDLVYTDALADNYEGLSSVEDDKGTVDEQDDVEYFEYLIEGDVVEESNVPALGVFDQFIIDVANDDEIKIYAPAADEDPAFGSDAVVNVELYAAARYKDGNLFIEVIRVVSVGTEN